MLALQLQPVPVKPRTLVDTMGPASSRISYTALPHCYHRMPSPTPEELRFFGLQSGDSARSRDTECSICQERVQDPVVTRCQHIFCFGCVYQWFGKSPQCPDCRQELHECYEEPEQNIIEEEATEDEDSQYDDTSRSDSAVVVVTSPDRYSSSQWVRSSGKATQDTSHHKYRMPAVVDNTARRVQTLASIVRKAASRESLRSLRVEEPPARRSTSAGYQYRNAPYASDIRKERLRQGHHQTPSYGSAAYAKLEFDPPRPLALDFDQWDLGHSRTASYVDQLRNQQKAYTAMVSHNEGRSTQSDWERETAMHDAQVIKIDAETMLSDMWQVSNSISDDVHVPIRCRAMAKCVWREWRYLLEKQDGRLLLAGDVLESLCRSYEKTVVEYGWVADWRELPEAFVEILKRTAEAAIRGE